MLSQTRIFDSKKDVLNKALKNGNYFWNFGINCLIKTSMEKAIEQKSARCVKDKKNDKKCLAYV